MKKIYIILTYTGTMLSKLIKIYTKYEYSHCSISLDKELKNMYSFGRLNPYNPFIGRFVHEGINIGTFKRFKNTLSEIYELEIDDLQYEKIKEKIENMENSDIKYRYNLLGVAGKLFHKKIKVKNRYYCTEFVKEVLDEANIENTLPSIATPEDFKTLDMKLEYKGYLKDYRSFCNS